MARTQNVNRRRRKTGKEEGEETRNEMCEYNANIKTTSTENYTTIYIKIS